TIRGIEVRQPVERGQCAQAELHREHLAALERPDGDRFGIVCDQRRRREVGYRRDGLFAAEAFGLPYVLEVDDREWRGGIEELGRHLGLPYPRGVLCEAHLARDGIAVA